MRRFEIRRKIGRRRDPERTTVAVGVVYGSTAVSFWDNSGDILISNSGAFIDHYTLLEELFWFDEEVEDDGQT